MEYIACDLDVIGTILTALVMLAVGAIIGLIPLILGRKRNKNELAIAGFASCAVGSLISNNIIVAVSLCILFVILILVLKDKNQEQEQNLNQEQSF